MGLKIHFKISTGSVSFLSTIFTTHKFLFSYPSKSFYLVDATFEAAVLGCTLEDQKRVKKRLSGLLSYFSTYSPSMSQIREEDDDEQLGNGAGRSSSSPASNSCL